MFFFDEDDNESCFPNLSWKERIVGFTLCFLFGNFIILLPFFLFSDRNFDRNSFIWLNFWNFSWLSWKICIYIYSSKLNFINWVNYF